MEIAYMKQVGFRDAVLGNAKDTYIYKNVELPKDVSNILKRWGGIAKIESDMAEVISYLTSLDDLALLEQFRRAIGDGYLRWVIANRISYLKKEENT